MRKTISDFLHNPIYVLNLITALGCIGMIIFGLIVSNVLPVVSGFIILLIALEKL